MEDIIRARCPVCRQGSIFNGLWKMNKQCFHCGATFEREQGFFIMSIYLAYAVDVLIVAPFVVYAIFTHQSLIWFVTAMILIVCLLTPFTLRITRTLWLYLDEWIDPRTDQS